MVEIGEKMKLEISRITSDGKGTAFTEDGKVVMIEGVSDNDESVEVEVTQIFEESIFAKKVGSIRTDSKKTTRSDLTDNPYPMDDGDDDYEDDDE